jgi:DNA-binding MarR family transcriptional regulator
VPPFAAPSTAPRKSHSPRSRRSAGEEATRSWLSVVRAYHLCSELMARRLGALGVRTAEHEILANLLREPGLSQQRLAARCFTAKSHVSGLLTALEQRGWVRREADPTDARARRLYLEPEGEHVAAQTARVQAEVVALMATAVGSEAMAQVQAAMALLSERLQAELEAGG